jgi:SNF2 family DNA or RNA helicase
MGGYGGYEIKGWQKQDELNEKLYSIAYRVTKDEVLDLPEVQDITQYCELGSSALKIYEELEGDFVAEIEAGTITASNALVKLLRLQQLTSGFVKTEEGVEHQIDAAKADLLDEIMEEIAHDEPLVVFCRFRHDLDLVQNLAKKHERSYAEISGRHLKDVMGLTEWQAGEATIIGVQIQSGGVGVDLSRARYCVYYSLGFSLGDYEQSRARVHRPGQERNVIYYHLLAHRARLTRRSIRPSRISKTSSIRYWVKLRKDE